jgi:UDP-glucose 4-epimerase
MRAISPILQFNLKLIIKISDKSTNKRGTQMQLSDLRILITGGGGFIGSHLADKLLQVGNEVICYDNFDSYYLNKKKNIEHNLKNPNYKLVKADILNYNLLKIAMKEVDIVFHLAAQPGVRFSIENPQKTVRANILGTVNVLKASLEQKVKKVIFASSSSVYGKPERLPLDEKHPTNPISPYGLSKLCSEKFCQLYHESYKENIVILRYFTVYGPRQRPDMAIHEFVKLLVQGKPPKIFGDGFQSRDFTYIDDAVRGTLLAAENDDAVGEVFNIGGGSKITVNELVELLTRLLRKEQVEPIHIKPKLGDVTHTHASIEKAKSMLGYQPKTSLPEGLKIFVKWYLKTYEG